MAGIKALRKVGLGLESTSTPGTLVEASTWWRGTGTIQDNMETVFVEEDIGNYGGSNLSYIAKYGGEITLEQDANFTQVLYPLLAGVQGEVAGVADTAAGTGYSYTFTMPTTAQGVFATYTIEGGDDAGAETMSYCFVPNFSISGAAGEALQLSATFRGQQVITGTFSDTATLPTVEPILFSNGAIWIDPDTDAIGTTPKSNTLLGMTLDVNTGLTEVYAANATKKFAFVKRVKPVITLSITFEHDATSIAEKAAWRANSARVLRLKFIGSAMATPGALLTNFLQIDLAGKWETFDKIGEQNGNDIVTGVFNAGYSSTAALYAQFIAAIDALATVP